jgi:hypothetical protein
MEDLEVQRVQEVQNSADGMVPPWFGGVYFQDMDFCNPESSYQSLASK